MAVSSIGGSGWEMNAGVWLLKIWPDDWVAMVLVVRVVLSA